MIGLISQAVCVGYVDGVLISTATHPHWLGFVALSKAWHPFCSLTGLAAVSPVACCPLGSDEGHLAQRNDTIAYDQWDTATLLEEHNECHFQRQRCWEETLNLNVEEHFMSCRECHFYISSNRKAKADTPPKKRH
jgi:hypothetical protein